MTRKDRAAYFAAYNKRRNALPATKAYQRKYQAAYYFIVTRRKRRSTQ